MTTRGLRHGSGLLTPSCGTGGQEERRTLPAADLNQAVVGLLNWLQSVGELGRVSAVGHRIVHGGPIHTDPQVVTPS